MIPYNYESVKDYYRQVKKCDFRKKTTECLCSTARRHVFLFIFYTIFVSVQSEEFTSHVFRCFLNTCRVMTHMTKKLMYHSFFRFKLPLSFFSTSFSFKKERKKERKKDKGTKLIME